MQRESFDECGGMLVIYFWPGGELHVHVRFPRTQVRSWLPTTPEFRERFPRRAR